MAQAGFTYSSDAGHAIRDLTIMQLRLPGEQPLTDSSFADTHQTAAAERLSRLATAMCRISHPLPLNSTRC